MTPTTPPGGSHAAVVLGLISRVAFTRECTQRLLASEPGWKPVDLGSGGPATLERVQSCDPDVILVDLPPADACRLAKALLEAVPGTRPVAVHRSLDAEELVALAEAGFVGFVSTDCSLQDLLRELRAVMRNESSGTPQLVGALIRSLKRQRQNGEDKSDHLAVLSTREREVARLLERRYSNKKIATELGIEFGTVKNHVHSVLTKLRLHNRWELQHLEKAIGSSVDVER